MRVFFTVDQAAALFDILFGGHENKNVAIGSPALQPVHGSCGRFDVVRIAVILLSLGARRFFNLVFGFYRVHPPGNLDNGCIAKGPGEFFRVDGG